MPVSARSIFFARLTLVLAAVLWSTGSLFSRVLKIDTPLGLHEPTLTPLQIAFWRSLFAGLVLIPLVRWNEVRFRPAMLMMAICFTTMSALYLTALHKGSAANAILLQNTAPIYVYFIGVYILGHATDRRLFQSTMLAMLGAAAIILGNWPWGQDVVPGTTEVLVMAAGSGFFYACVVMFLGFLKSESAAWLMIINLLGTAFGLAIFMIVSDGWSAFVTWASTPTTGQLAFLALFGALQMAAPYFLFARGLKYVSAQEAGIITLLEPVLNPIWAYLIDPAAEKPTLWTYIGGTILLFALALRYVPHEKK